MTNSLIRPAWTPVTIAMMVIGFMIAWPLGLAMIAYIIWGDRLEIFKDDINKATDKVADTFRNAGRNTEAPAQTHKTYTRPSGNAAFDDWREKEFTCLDEERRKLDETRAEFDEYQRDLQRARDKEEFEEFLKSRKRKPAPRSKKSGGDVIET